jgi:hypothetical protein
MNWLLSLYLLISPLHTPTAVRWPMMQVAQPAQVVQNPTEPPEFPDGVYCTPQGKVYKGLQTPDEPCHCQIMMREDQDGCCNIQQNNDPKCTQYCHEQHCRCPHECVTGGK